MPVISCYVADDILRLLQIASEETGRKVEELAEAAIEGSAIQFKNSRPSRSTRREVSESYQVHAMKLKAETVGFVRCGMLFLEPPWRWRVWQRDVWACCGPLTNSHRAE